MMRTRLVLLLLFAAIALRAQTPTPAQPVAVLPQMSVVFWVTDLQRSADFFGKVLGCEVQYLMKDVGFGELSTAVPGVHIGLARGRRKGEGSVVPTFAVASADEAAERLAALGVKLLRPVQEMPGLCKLVAFADPDGNEVQLVESLLPKNEVRSEWSKVAFLAGGWRSEEQGVVTEEVWTTPIGSVMHGQNRTMQGERLMMFELLRIAIDGDGKLYYEARPAARAPTRFALVSSAANRVTFANMEHDFPKRIHYRLEGNVLHATIDDGRDDGKRMEFVWQRIE